MTLPCSWGGQEFAEVLDSSAIGISGDSIVSLKEVLEHYLKKENDDFMAMDANGVTPSQRSASLSLGFM